MLCAAGPAMAQVEAPFSEEAAASDEARAIPHKPVDAPWSLTALWENDGTFMRPVGSDRHYTNGMMLTLAHQPKWADNLADALDLEYDATAAGYLVGQLMFTPRDLTRVNPDPNDRPYAGYLFGGVYWQREHDEALDHVQLDLGVVGPSSLAGDLQQATHNTLEGDDPRGWDAQIEDTFAYQLTYRRKWRVALNGAASASEQPRQGLAALDWQLLPQLGFGLGNVYRQAEAGATLRFGMNMPDDFGPARIADLGSATALSTNLVQAAARPEDGWWSWYLFGRAGARAVQHNIFLDGPDGEGGPAVDSEPLVGELSAGFVGRARLGDQSFLRLEYTQTLLSHEFEGQSELDGYATLILAINATW